MTIADHSSPTMIQLALLELMLGSSGLAEEITALEASIRNINCRADTLEEDTDRCAIRVSYPKLAPSILSL